MLDCNVIVSEFEYWSHYNIRFRTNTFERYESPYYTLSMGVQLLFFYKDGFNIK